MTLMTWLIVFALIAINALYVAAEFAAVSVRRSHIRQLADDGNSRARRLIPILATAASLDRYISASQIGITVSSLLLGAYGQATIAGQFAPLFERWGGLDHLTAFSVAAVVVLIVLTTLQIILGELVPKSLALQYSSQTALLTVAPMAWSLTVFSWFIVVLNGSGVAILKMLRIPYGGHRHIHSPEEIDMLLAESRDGGLLEEDEHDRLHEALQLSSRSAHELMIPRRYVTAIDVDAPAEVILRHISEGPYTRLPVFQDSLDNIIGIVHIKDFTLYYLQHGELPKLPQILRPAVFVPETITADRLLTILRDQHSHQALVVDEYGGIEGLITLEDVLTELLGEVGDEFKLEAPEAVRLPDGRVRLAGLLLRDEAAAWTNRIWEGDADTVGGYITEVLGHIPAVGEQLVIDEVLVEVERIENHAVKSLLVTPAPPLDEEETNA